MAQQIDGEKMEQIKETGETWVIDFWAEWCGPCKQMEPVFEQVSEEVDDVAFGKVDLDDNQELATQEGVRSVPTFLLVEDGEEVDRKTGVMSESAFREWVEGYA